MNKLFSTSDKRLERSSVSCRSFFCAYLLAFCLLASGASATERIDRLLANGKSYSNVVIKEVTESSLIVTHSKGISQLEFKDLPAEIQERFGYDSVLDDQRRQKMAREARAREESRQRKNSVKARPEQASKNLMSRFGSAPVIRANVDYRPTFSKLELGTRNQGSRPSCSVFAMVGALEYIQAIKTGKTEKLSEEYLVWAVLKTLGKSRGSIEGTGKAGMDAGFTLLEVAQALRAYGIPLRSQMPYSLLESGSEGKEPTPTLIDDARRRAKISAYLVPGRTNDVKIANIIHSLNDDVPIVIGVAWPHYNKLANTALLSKQKPQAGGGHAVTLVGYRCETGKLEDVSFIFRNSWGRSWGAGGYGIVRYEYLAKYLNSAVIMEL